MRRASRLACGFFVALALVVASGCDLFTGHPSRDASVDAPDVTYPWTLGMVARGPHAPGTWLRYPVEGVDVPADDVQLWVIEDDVAFPLRSYFAGIDADRAQTVTDDDAGPPDAGSDAATDAGPRSSYLFAGPLPIARAGVFHLALGTADEPRTRPVEVEVRLSGAMMPQAEAADVLAAGLSGMGADLADVLRSDDAEWQSLVSDAGLSPVIGSVDGIATDIDALAALMRDQYMALPADVEPGMQELMWNSGMLQALSARAGGASMLALGGGILDSALARSPAQGLLFTLDTFSLVLGLFSLACDVVAIVGAALTAPAGGEGALVGVGPKIVAAALRVVIDDLLPTDLTRFVEVHSSRIVYETEGSMVVPWGLFAPQNRMAGGQLRSLEDLVLAIIEAVIPGGGAGRTALGPILRRTGEWILTHLPGFLADFIGQQVDFPHVEILLPVDMGFYNIQLSQVLSLNPVLYGLSVAAAALWNPELVSPYSAYFPRDGRVTAGYDTRSVGFTDVAWQGSAPTERVPTILSVRGFAFATNGPAAFAAQYVAFPSPVTSDIQRFFQVQRAPDPADRNARISDEDFIALDVNLPGGGTSRIVRASTPTIRVYPLQIDDLAGGRPDLAMVDVIVNGTAQYPGQVVPDGTLLTLPLMLEPGVNEVEVVGTAGHTIGCGASGMDAVCLEITFPEADNVNQRVVAYGEVGVRRSFRIWTPPVLPM